MTFLDDLDLVRRGGDARGWLLRDRDIARRGRDAGAWLTHDERGRVIGLVLLSVAVSIAMSVMATIIVGFVSRRRAAVPDEPMASEAPPEDEPSAGEGMGIPVMDVPAKPAEAEVPLEA